MTPAENPKAVARKAAMLSVFVLPGAGQIYRGQYVKGAVMAVGALTFAGVFLFKLGSGYLRYMRTMMDLSDPSATTRPMSGSWLWQSLAFGLAPLVVLYVVSVWDAYAAKTPGRAPAGISPPPR